MKRTPKKNEELLHDIAEKIVINVLKSSGQFRNAPKDSEIQYAVEQMKTLQFNHSLGDECYYDSLPKNKNGKPIHLSSFEETKWVVISDDGMVNFRTAKYRRSDSIKEFMSLWDPGRENGKWWRWRKRGYSCQKINFSVHSLSSNH